MIIKEKTIILYFTICPQKQGHSPMSKKTRDKMIIFCKYGCPRPPHWTKQEFDDYYRSLDDWELIKIYRDNLKSDNAWRIF